MDNNNESLQRLLFDKLDDAFWVNVNERAVYVNSAFERIWGVSCEDIYTNSQILIDAIHLDDKQTVLDIINSKPSKEGDLVNYDYRIVRPDNTIRWISAKSISIFDENEKDVKNIGTARDITLLKESAIRVQESENRFRKLFENMPAGVAIYKSVDNGQNFQFVDFNKAAEKITHISKEEVLNKKLLDVFPNMGDSSLFKALQEVEKTGQELHLEPFFYKDNIREGWRENHIYKLTTGEIVAIFEDVTKRKNAEILLKNQNVELQKARERAEESSRLKTEFLNNMSHEVRTPMNGIIGFAQLLDSPEISKEEMVSYSKTVQDSTYQLLRIMEDILEISTLETKQKKIVETQFCLNDLLDNLLSASIIAATKKGLSLNLKKALLESQSQIISDKTKLNKILSNIIENAIRFTNEGFVEIGYYLEFQNIVLYVKDTGVGISPINHKTIFECFSQEEKELSRKYGGLGLGLSISKENAQLLGGDITLESQKGVGSTFFITIPYKPAAN